MYQISTPLHCVVSCLILKAIDGGFIKNCLVDFVLGLEQNFQQFIKWLWTYLYEVVFSAFLIIKSKYWC